MRYLWLLALPFLFGFSQIYDTHKNAYETDQELDHICDQAQDRQFTVKYTTPNYQDLQDGEIVIYSSSVVNPLVFLMLRVGTTMYVSPQFQKIQGR